MRITIPANTWINIKKALNLSDDVDYFTMNVGTSLIHVSTEYTDNNEPTEDPRKVGFPQTTKEGNYSAWTHSASSGYAIYAYSFDIDGQLEVSHG